MYETQYISYGFADIIRTVKSASGHNGQLFFHRPASRPLITAHSSSKILFHTILPNAIIQIVQSKVHYANPN